jgi:hypothetical protein
MLLFLLKFSYLSCCPYVLQVYSPNYVIPPPKCCSDEMDMDLRYFLIQLFNQSFLNEKHIVKMAYVLWGQLEQCDPYLLIAIKEAQLFSLNFSLVKQILVLQFLHILWVTQCRYSEWVIVFGKQAKLGWTNRSSRFPFSSNCHCRAAVAASWIWWLCICKF